MFRKLALIGILPLLLFLNDIDCKATAGQAPTTLELGPMLGYTGPDKARIWLKASSATQSGIIIGEAEDLHDGQIFKGPELTIETEYVGIVEVTGLKPVTRYFYKPVLDRQVYPEPPFSFVTAPPKGFQTHVRYHRSPNNSKDDGQKTMLGQAQLMWLKQGLAESQATFKFLVSGSQWNSKEKTDSWRSFIRERNELFQFIIDKGIEGVVLLSGDRHLTAGYLIQERFVEISSCPFASENHGLLYNPGEMFMLHNQGNFFVVIEVDPKAEQPDLIFEVHQIGKGIVRRRQLSWQEINGEALIQTCELISECRN